MNYLLQINKKIVLFGIFTLVFIVLFIIIFNQAQIKKNIIKYDNKEIESNFDIFKPKFTINNQKQKILITAQHGKFIKENQIFLKKNVIFKSKKFRIYSDNVIFNKLDQTASSNNKSLFISKGTEIKSEGFNIIDKGNIIKFNGKTQLILSK